MLDFTNTQIKLYKNHEKPILAQICCKKHEKRKLLVLIDIMAKEISRIYIHT